MAPVTRAAAKAAQEPSKARQVEATQKSSKRRTVKNKEALTAPSTPPPARSRGRKAITNQPTAPPITESYENTTDAPTSRGSSIKVSIEADWEFLSPPRKQERDSVATIKPDASDSANLGTCTELPPNEGTYNESAGAAPTVLSPATSSAPKLQCLLDITASTTRSSGNGISTGIDGDKSNTPHERRESFPAIKSPCVGASEAPVEPITCPPTERLPVRSAKSAKMSPNCAVPPAPEPESPPQTEGCGSLPHQHPLETRSELLKGAVFYSDVKGSDGRDANDLFDPLLEELGATVVPSWSDDNTSITHVLFRDGDPRTLEKVAASNGVVKAVKISWPIE